MDAKTKKILTKLGKEKVDLIAISQAKNIIKEFDKIADINSDASRELQLSITKMINSDQEANSKTERINKEIISLKDKRIKIFDENISEKKRIAQSMTKLINEVESEIQKTKKNINKGEIVLKNFKNELDELGIKTSSSRLYEELEASISLTQTVISRAETSLKSFKNNGYYLEYK